MKVLDLFAGLRGWSAAFGYHEVVTIELDPSFPGITRYWDVLMTTPADIRALFDGEAPDLILASPPCTAFTTMTMGRNWTHEGEPKTPVAVMGKALVERTLFLIEALQPRWWILENPRARLRSLGLIPDTVERRTVTYCQLGEERMKPTDLWGRFPMALQLPAMCKNGDACHVRAPRGSYTGTQGMASAESAKVPYQLSRLVRDACERDLWELGG